MPGLSPLEFLTHLRHPDEKGWVEFRYLKPNVKQSVENGWLSWPPDGDEVIKLRRKQEMYFGVLPRTSNLKGDAAHCGQGGEVWMDFDFKSTIYAEEALEKYGDDLTHVPPVVLDRAARQAFNDITDDCERIGLPPLTIVYSGHGLQVYWGLDQLKDKAWIVSVNKGLADYFSADSQSTDAARILRVPGGYNLKNPKRPLLVSVWHQGEERLDPELFESYRKIEKTNPLPESWKRVMEQGGTPWTPTQNDLRLLVEHWDVGNRHELALAFGGWCASHGAPQQVAVEMLKQLCSGNSDDEIDDRLRALETSYVRVMAGKPVLGGGTLRRHVPGLSGVGSVQIATLQPSSKTEGEVVLPPEYREGEFGELLSVKTFDTRQGPREETSLLATRMIRIEEILTSLDGPELHLRLSWRTSGGEVISQTLSIGEASSRSGLQRLAHYGAPIDEVNAGLLTRYVQRVYSMNMDSLTVRKVASVLGWHGDTFCLPGGDTEVLDFEAEPWTPRGNAEVWLEGLRALLSWGETPALVVMAASVCAPAVRLLRLAKNPVLALSTLSHTGKTTAVRFALSLWANPEYGESLYFDATTISGLMSKLFARQDLPIAFDDHQRYQDRDINEFMHLLSGGAEKLRARRDGGERAVRRWKGVAILTGESTALRDPTSNGAMNRLIELSDYPLGVPKGEEGFQRASLLHGAVGNFGTVREKVLELYRTLSPIEEAPKYASWAAREGVPGDMAEIVGALGYGVRLLAAIAGSTEPWPERLMLYVGARLAEMRERHGSIAGRAMTALRSLLVSFQYNEESREIYDGSGQLIAFTTDDTNLVASERRSWYVNPTANQVMRVMERYGGVDGHLAQWAEKGWIKVEEDGSKRRFRVQVHYKGHKFRWILLAPQGGDVDV